MTRKHLTRKLTLALRGIRRLEANVAKWTDELRNTLDSKAGIYRSSKDPDTNRHHYIRVWREHRSAHVWLGRDDELVLDLTYAANRCTKDGSSRSRDFNLTPKKLATYTLVETSES